MPAKSAVLPRETFRFLRDLALHNSKLWMDANRERYQSELVAPFRALLDCFAPAARKLNEQFVINGKVDVNLSRINRDIRFAKDKTPYRPQMYLFFAEADREGGQLYIGASADQVTCGFRIYGSGRETPLVQLGRARAREHRAWIERQRRNLARGYQSYWYSSEKGEWTRHSGWPLKPEDWKKLQGWVVRKKFSPAAAGRSTFRREACKIFRETYPLLAFTGSSKWKG